MDLIRVLPLHNRVFQYLDERDVKVILIGLMSDFRATVERIITVHRHWRFET